MSRRFNSLLSVALGAYFLFHKRGRLVEEEMKKMS